MIKKVKTALRSLADLNNLGRDLSQTQNKIYQIERESFIRNLLQNSPKYQDSGNLNIHEYQIFSQSGQDGIIAEIFRRVGATNRTAVEIGVGVGGGLENNTVALLARGWNAAWFEANIDLVDLIARNLEHLVGEQLYLNHTAVTAENALHLLQDAKTPKEFDFLSIDVDGNDLYIWQSLRDFRPRVVAIEYNSYFPAEDIWCVPYRTDASWTALHIEFGASLKALEIAGNEMGYKLVGCDLTGSDAFFVREDLCKTLFQSPFTSEIHYEPMRYHLIQRPGYSRTYSKNFCRITTQK